LTVAGDELVAAVRAIMLVPPALLAALISAIRSDTLAAE
jgi:hypothetical protein